MKMTEFLKFIIKSLDFSYENELYLQGYIDGLSVHNQTVTVEEYNSPFFNILYNKFKEEGNL